MVDPQSVIWDSGMLARPIRPAMRLSRSSLRVPAPNLDELRLPLNLN